MTFPDIKYKYNGLEEAPSLAPIVEQKLSGLEKYLNGKGSAICEVEFEKVAPHQNGHIYRTEVNLTIDGTLYRAEAVEESFEKAIDEMKNELDTELRRDKNKQAALEKSAGREFKEQLQTGE